MFKTKKEKKETKPDKKEISVRFSIKTGDVNMENILANIIDAFGPVEGFECYKYGGSL